MIEAGDEDGGVLAATTGASQKADAEDTHMDEAIGADIRGIDTRCGAPVATWQRTREDARGIAEREKKSCLHGCKGGKRNAPVGVEPM